MMGYGYRTIEHTADIGLIAYGATLPEAFLNAAKGMSSIIIDLRTINTTTREDIAVEESDSEKLLYAWLNYLLYYFDTRGIIFRRFELISFTNKRLEVSCYGEKYDPRRHTIKTGIKAATFHRLLVDSKNKRVRVFLDV